MLLLFHHFCCEFEVGHRSIHSSETCCCDGKQLARKAVPWLDPKTFLDIWLLLSHFILDKLHFRFWISLTGIYSGLSCFLWANVLVRTQNKMLHHVFFPLNCLTSLQCYVTLWKPTALFLSQRYKKNYWRCQKPMKMTCKLDNLHPVFLLCFHL